MAGVSIRTRLEIVRLFNRLGQRLAIARGHPARVETERFDYLVDQVLAAAIQRLRVDERTASFQEREHHGKDRSHAGIEDGRGVGAALERHELLLEDFGVGMVQARIDEVGTIVAERMDFSKHNSKGTLGRLGTWKYER